MIAEQARQADALVAMTGTQASSDDPYLYDGLKALGTRLHRESMLGDPAGPRGPKILARWTELGIPTVLTVAKGQSASTCVAVVKRLGAAVAAVEGWNEPDHDYHDPDQTWVAPTKTVQDALYAAMKADPATAAVPVIGPSLSWHSFPTGPWACDLGNAHLYDQPFDMAATGTTNAWYSQVLSYDRAEFAGLPLWVTEFGHRVGDTFSSVVTSERVQACYVLRSLLEKFASGQFAALVQYQFRDLGPAAGTQDGFGLVRYDGSRKPAFTGLANVLALLADKGPAFTPGALSYDLSGNLTNVRRLVLQRRDGRFLLVLWLHVQSTDAPQQQDVTLGLQAGQFSAARVYAPLTQAAPVGAVVAPVSVALQVQDAPIVVELVPAASPTMTVVPKPKRKRGILLG